jgi:hypothetical protein
MEREKKTIEMDITITVPVKVEVTELDETVLISLPEYNSHGSYKKGKDVEESVQRMLVSRLDNVKWKINNQGR